MIRIQKWNCFTSRDSQNSYSINHSVWEIQLMMFPVHNCIVFLVWMQYQFNLTPFRGWNWFRTEFMQLIGTVIRSRNVGRQMAVVETWMEVRRLAFSPKTVSSATCHPGSRGHGDLVFSGVEPGADGSRANHGYQWSPPLLLDTCDPPACGIRGTGQDREYPPRIR